MEFFGGYETRIDEKGRLKLSADLKRAWDETYGSPKIYMTSKDGKRLDLYPLKVWQGVLEKLKTLGSMSVSRKKFMDRTNYFGMMGEIDAQGRILLSQRAREELSLKEEVLVSVDIDFLQVSNLAQYKAEMRDDPPTDAENAEIAGLGI